MKEITTTIYKCSICGSTFSEKDKCRNHEKSHTLDEKLNMVENSAVCPMCEGKGWYYGTDGVDTRFCGQCNGLGIVHKMIQTTERIIPID